MKLNKKKGFTIVELVIVIAVIGVLTAILVPVFINLTNKANEASDQTLVKNLNTVLATKEQALGYKTTTYQKVIDIVDDAGYKVPNLVAKSGEDLFWNQKTNRFYLGSKKDTSLPDYTYWTIKDALDGTETYSVYAGLNFNAKTVDNLKAGFDVGAHTDITDINYVGTANKQDGVTFRVQQDYFTNFSNNNNKQDEVKVYGYANRVYSERSGQQSLYINENVATLEIKEGHVVVAPGVKIGSLVFKATSTNNFDKIVVEIPDVQEQVTNIYRSNVSTSLPENVKVEVATIKTTQASETYFLEGNGTIEDAKLLVSNTGDVADAQPVEEATASDAAKAIANAKIGDVVIDTGISDAEIKEVVEDTKNEKQAEEAEKRAEEEGIDFSTFDVRIGLVGYSSFAEALAIAKPGETITFLKDLDLTSPGLYSSSRIQIVKDITIDGAGYEATVSYYGFGVFTHKAAFKNITINNTYNQGPRCIDVRPNFGNNGVFVEQLDLYRVTLSTDGFVRASGYNQPLTIGGDSRSFIDSETGKARHIKVNIENSDIRTNDTATAYYSIVVFNPVDLTIKDSSIKGWANIYMQPSNGSYGSRGSNVSLINCELESKNIYNGTSNAFGLIIIDDQYSYFSDEPYHFSLEGCDVTVNASSDQKQAFMVHKSYDIVNLALGENNTLTFNGTDAENGRIFLNPSKHLDGDYSIANGTVIACQDISIIGLDEILNETQTYRNNGDGTYTIIAKAE